MSGDYEAGSGDDKIYTVLGGGRLPKTVRSRANAMLLAREALKAIDPIIDGVVAIFNTEANTFEFVSDDRFFGVGAAKDMILAADKEVTAAKAEAARIRAANKASAQGE